jgi:hypothetical protein
LWATVPQNFSQNNIRYKTSFGECPTKSSGEFAILIMKEFERARSLKEVKERILTEKLDEKYFVSEYHINYNPVSQTVKMNFTCPEALVRVQVYRDNGKEHYSAVMVSTGKLFDPSYEMILKAEKKLKADLPSLAISVKDLEGEVHESFTRFATQIKPEIRQKISEIIINDNKELSIIFAMGHRTTSVFLGSDLWEMKLEKLTKIISYVEKSQKYPTTINLTNAKKVVVKF